MAKKAVKAEEKKAAPRPRKAAPRAKAAGPKVAKAAAPAPTAAPPAERRHPFGALREEMNRLFDEFDPWNWPLRRPDFMPEMAWPWAKEGRMAPAMDLVERDDAYEVSAELPGLAPEDVEVEMSDRVLTIKGEKREETEKKEADYHLSERRYGAFRRVLTLPDGVDADRISAKVVNGVLKVTLPKLPAAKSSAKRVAVKPG
ncbi:MAG: Hsp20/alpha crystallin family protein [Paracoccaceae bacterium]|nr:Hsp20/alpha crystallin family protein [Paracoccaceae bacterium]